MRLSDWVGFIHRPGPASREVAGAGEVEGRPGRLCGRDDLVVADRPARRHHGPHAAVEQDLQPVGEREEGVGGGDRPGGAVLRPGHREPAGVDPVDLAHADPDGRPARGEQDGVGLHRPHRPPREGEVGQGRGIRSRTGDEPPQRRVVTPRRSALALDDGVHPVAGLDEQPPGDGARLPRVDSGDIGLGQHEQPPVPLLPQDREGVVVVGRRHDDLGEGVVERRRHRGGHRTVRRDDPAVRRHRVARVRRGIRLLDGVPDGDATRVGVLDDRDGRLVAMVVGGPHRGVGVDVVVVRHLLAVQLLGGGEPGPPVGVERGLLVRVLAVAQDVRLLEGRPGPRGEAAAVGGVGIRRPHPAGHRDVVGRRVDERLRREPLARLEREPAGRHGLQDGVVGRGRGDDGDARVVLGRGADHRRSADVDLLDALVGRRAGLHGLPERVEVDDDELERLDPELVELGEVVGLAGVGEDPGVHPRVEGLDPALEALGEAGEVGHLGDGEAEVGDEPGRAAGRDEGDAGVVQTADQVLEAALVVDGDERPADGPATIGGGHGGTPQVSVSAPRRTMHSS